MSFMRRKSSAATDAEEVRPRRRLSKPMTSKSPPQKTSPVRQSPKPRSGSVSLSSSQMSLADIARTMSKKELRGQNSSQLLQTENVLNPRPISRALPKRKAVASLVAQFENAAASASQTSLVPPPVPPKPVSTTYGAQRLAGLQEQQNLSKPNSRELLKLHTQSMSTMTGSSGSLEQQVDPFAIPRRRESKYRPGDATRKSSAEDKENVQPGKEEPNTTDNHDKSLSAKPEVKLDKEEEQWALPPAITRTDTPSSVDFRAIGGLKLGSLHVVNGRTSPILSELSRHLISKQLRDVSSAYADSTYSKDNASDTWEDADVAPETDDVEVELPSTPTRVPVSVEHEEIPVATEQETFSPSETPPKAPATPDKTAMMAQAYMSELQGSPFSFGTISPLSTGSVVHHIEELEDEPVSRESPNNPEEVRTMSIKSEQPSIESGPSVPETVKTRDQVFSSALEFQAPHFEPPRSPERGISPVSERPKSVSGLSGKVDSGYDSGISTSEFNSVAARTEKRKPLPHLSAAQSETERAIREQNAKQASPKKESSPSRLGRFFQRRSGVRKSIGIAPEVPATATIRKEPVTATPPAAPVTKPEAPSDKAVKDKPEAFSKKAKKEKEKEAKNQKKLQKLRPRSRGRESKDIVVQRLASCESTMDLPAVTDTAKANLHRRSMQVPELERTFKSQDHIKNQPSISNLDLLTMNIKFPSSGSDLDVNEQPPQRVKDHRSRSNSRSRSRGRRHSFLDMFRSDRSRSRHEEEATKEDTEFVIADYGDMLSSLGANPYAITNSKPTKSDAPSRTAPASALPVQPPNSFQNYSKPRRLSMTDEQASEYARMRSHSFNGRDRKGERKQQLLDDHGLVLGKYLKTPTDDEEVPPMPPLPDREELRRISQRVSMHGTHPNTPTGSRRTWEQTPSPDREMESSPAPLPPTHSPRPMYADPAYEGDHIVEDEFELAPPPPSHSPRPMDIEPESPWDRQAHTWREKRRSANEALRSHRQSLDLRHEYTHDDSSMVEDDRELAYPVIPPRHPDRSEPPRQQPARWASPAAQYDHADPEYYVQRSRTWDEDNHHSYQEGEQDFKVSRSSFQSRQRRHNTWDDNYDYDTHQRSVHFSQQEPRSSRQSNHRSIASTDSRQFFQGQHNMSVEHPYNRPPRLSGDSRPGSAHEAFFTPQASPMRGRRKQRNEYQYPGFDNYNEQYHTYQYDSFEPENEHYPYDGYNDYPHTPPKRPLSQQYPLFQPSPDLSRHDQSPVRPQFQPEVPSSPALSHRNSFDSNNADITSADKRSSEFTGHLIQPLEFGRYSGGLKFGYEGRDAGFGGSAGTRGGSGKADGQFKSLAAREKYGVDLADVPIIGVIKRVPVGSK